jgi:8-oxo-dGTP pyrophosphatase MutT (NUDIX family)
MLSTHGSEFSTKLRSCRIPDTLCTMAREVSAGGVVLREIDGTWHVALIEPQRQNSQPPASRRRAAFALPKGLVDPGEKPAETAVREVQEETGIVGKAVTKLADIKYVYTRTWGGGERVFKVVSFYLLRYLSGEIGDITPEMRIEVKQALWVPVSEAPKQLAYSNERKVVRQAWDYVAAYGLEPEKPA